MIKEMEIRAPLTTDEVAGQSGSSESYDDAETSLSLALQEPQVDMERIEACVAAAQVAYTQETDKELDPVSLLQEVGASEQVVGMWIAAHASPEN